MASPIISPVPPAMTMTLSSSTPWGTISAQKAPSSPEACTAAPSVPRVQPLRKRMAAVGRPSRMPPAKHTRATRTLFWMMNDASSGAAWMLACTPSRLSRLEKPAGSSASPRSGRWAMVIHPASTPTSRKAALVSMYGAAPRTARGSPVAKNPPSDRSRIGAPRYSSGWARAQSALRYSVTPWPGKSRSAIARSLEARR